MNADINSLTIIGLVALPFFLFISTTTKIIKAIINSGYLKEKDAALCATSYNEILNAIKLLTDDDEIINLKITKNKKIKQNINTAHTVARNFLMMRSYVWAAVAPVMV